MEHAITYVGLDVHKDTIAVAIAETGRRGEVREHGKIANTPTALKGLVSRLTRSAATHHRSGGHQPALINRRLMIVPPAMPSSGRTEQLDEREKKFLRLLLEMANMRVDGIQRLAPAVDGGDDLIVSGFSFFSPASRLI